MSAQQVMRVAQGLYERGYITYMRTDSTNLSETAIAASRKTVEDLYGATYLPEKPRLYAKKVKNAQEAHEAIRPAGDVFRTPESLALELKSDDFKLYELIWKRTIASQMMDAAGQSVSLRVTAKTGQEEAELSASGRSITFPGYLRAYVEGADDPEAELDDKESLLPVLKVGEALPVPKPEALGHTTQAVARYTEASLVKKLEELGVGRPSTYASILSTILNRGYVWKKGTALVPTWTAFAVIHLLEKHFPNLVDYAFTAKMEDELDEIANQTNQRVPWLKHFYFGDDKAMGLHKLVDSQLETIDAAAINSIPIGKDPNGVDIVVKPGRYGPYIRRGEDTCSIPDDLAPDDLNVAKALQLLALPKGTEPIGKDPKSGLPVFVKSGRFGPYVQLGDAETLPKDEKPKMASLFKDMQKEPSKVTLDQALQLLSLPRVLGKDPADGVEVTAHNGKFGPYVKKGTDSRNLGEAAEPKLLTMTLEDALEELKKPKQFRGRSAPKPPLKELGVDPVSNMPMVVREGRFGLYVTDGESNATLRKGDILEELTFSRASELLAERRAQGPVVKKGRNGRPAPKAKAAKAAKATTSSASAEAEKSEAGAEAKAAKPAKAPKAAATEKAEKPEKAATEKGGAKSAKALAAAKAKSAAKARELKEANDAEKAARAAEKEKAAHAEKAAAAAAAHAATPVAPVVKKKTGSGSAQAH
jgi:DNA topoisomerase-1